jgi:hypothetical protein
MLSSTAVLQQKSVDTKKKFLQYFRRPWLACATRSNTNDSLVQNKSSWRDAMRDNQETYKNLQELLLSPATRKRIAD